MSNIRIAPDDLLRIAGPDDSPEHYSASNWLSGSEFYTMWFGSPDMLEYRPVTLLSGFPGPWAVPWSDVRCGGSGSDQNSTGTLTSNSPTTYPFTYINYISHPTPSHSYAYPMEVASTPQFVAQNAQTSANTIDVGHSSAIREHLAVGEELSLALDHAHLHSSEPIMPTTDLLNLKPKTTQALQGTAAPRLPEESKSSPFGNSRGATGAISPPMTTKAAFHDGSCSSMSLDIYEWMFAVLYPKRRSNKTKSTPSGQCRFCPSVSKHAGSLQQHLIVIHRQRIARKVRANQEINSLFALAFVVAQLEAEPVEDHAIDSVAAEYGHFMALLAVGPVSNEHISPDTFPLLMGKLEEFSLRESWIGVSCPSCGTWVTRRSAMREHAAVCTGAALADPAPGSYSDAIDPHVPSMRLTASGRAARPSRESARKTRGQAVKLV